MIEEGGITGPASVDLAAVARFGEEDGTVEDLAVPNVRNVGVGIHAKCRTTSDVMGLEERLRSEMRFLGLLDDTEVPGPDPSEQDEICVEMRALQSELRQQVAENTKRKQILHERASYYRGWEQYNSVLDAISKQIESDYLKRFRQNPNKKKKSSSKTTASLIPGTLVGGVLSAKHHNIHEQTLDNIKKRKMLIESIGSLFPYEKVTIPVESIYPRANGASGAGGSSSAGRGDEGDGDEGGGAGSTADGDGGSSAMEVV
ncbi:hypothetical protein BCR33DRAFT_657515 [Rhizoclosmatium globosum]|uniref:Uncharacterized protein n=1 Tax=Rhizoclosmatium globosum TaxID=329046 RepID=A0A1Y2CNQ1_9FUNG|nr:hypothetical protein BCR33DRAFT_657515 [Rhizoclosmatium globosum]|eukprot:ORY48607.1 hypothetical protein BCR33DRAFT_657515 [Rhizoclosmatium globosum]